MVAGLLCLSLAIWSLVPTFSHAPSVLKTIQDHLEMVEDHGHSHGFEEDLIWALHGHSHDMADHDHNQAFLLIAQNTEANPEPRETWRMMPSATGPSRQFRIDRPPRA